MQKRTQTRRCGLIRIISSLYWLSRICGERRSALMNPFSCWREPTARVVAPEAAIMYARALLQRRLEGDAENAIALLRPLKLTDLRPEYRPMIISTAVDAFVSQQKFDEARQYSPTPAKMSGPEVTTVLLGPYRVCRSGNQAAEAETLAMEAKSGLSKDTGPVTQEFVARLLRGGWYRPRGSAPALSGFVQS